MSKDKKEISKIFIEDYNKCNFKINEKDYNILITHSPIAITYKMEDIDELNNIDLVITGHLHNGHLPKKMKSLDNKKTGIFFVPFALPFPGMICRGLHKFKRGYLLISKGFRNLTADVLLFNLIEKISVNEIEEVIVQNCKRSKGKIVKN